MRNNYLCALDLGSSKIAAGLALLSKNKNVGSLFLDSVVSRGIKKGKVLGAIDLSEVIAKLLDNLKAKSGINVKSIYLNVYGQDIVTKHSRATIALAERGNKIITNADTRRLIEEAKILGSSLEEEIIHQIPLTYKVDDQDNIINPLGLYGHSLEVDLYLICVKSAYIQNISRLINHIGYEIKGFFLCGIATSKVIFGQDRFRKGLQVLIDIGSDITQIHLFKDAVLQDLRVLSLGGDDLTYELAAGLKLTFELAEEIKKSYAAIGEYKDFPDKEVMIKKEGSYKPVSRRLICEITTAKAKQLIHSIRSSLKEIIPELDCVDSVVVGGRTVLIDGFLEMMEVSLGCGVTLARFSSPAVFTAVKEEIVKSTPRFLKYATVLGLICEGVESTKNWYLFRPTKERNPIRKIFNRAKEIYQEYF